MRYANLWWPYADDKALKSWKVNIGDELQFFAIENLYAYMGIPREEIVRISMDEVVTYDGDEYLVLPLNWSLFDGAYMSELHINISPKIIPVFLAVTLGVGHRKEYFNECNIEYLKKHSPIGCRDEVTMNTLRKYGIEAYLNGCLTAMLPQREKEYQGEKVFFVDAPIELKKYVPKELCENTVCMTQQYYYSKESDREEIIIKIKEQYAKFVREAKLVITSRLHVASPCMALGIPVIFAKRKVDERFAWLDKMIPLYDKSQFADIDWNPQRVEYEELKEKVLANASKRMHLVWENQRGICEISEFFENRKKRKYTDFRETLFSDISDIKNYLESVWCKGKKVKYSLWGINNGAQELVDYISSEWENASLKNVIDTYNDIQFCGRKSIKPEMICAEEDEYFIVMAVGASNAAGKLFAELNIPEERTYIAGDAYISSME